MHAKNQDCGVSSALIPAKVDVPSARLDQEILAFLKEHPRAANTLIGRALGISGDAVARAIDRMKRLNDLKIVAIPSLLIDNRTNIGFVQIRIKGPRKGFDTYLASHPFVTSVCHCTGQFQIVAMFQFGNTSELSELTEYIGKFSDEVDHIEYNFALEIIKSDFLR
jgi:DNA-binding Lrp family transcriptional regulator